MTTDEFNRKLKSITSNVKSEVEKAVKLCCEKVRADILTSMANTPRNTDVSYYTHNKKIPHHPSLPGNAPAPDTGNLRQSIHYTVNKSENGAIGRIGSTLGAGGDTKTPPYGAYLEDGTSNEYGTSKMAPRPWLKPSMDKNNQFIKNTLKQAVKGGMKK